MNGRFLSETMLVIILLIMMGLFAVTRFANGGFSPEQAGSINNDGDSGTQLFFNWMRQRGYAVQVAEDELRLGNTAVLFIIAPSSRINPLEAEQINQWVQQGGTLVLVQEQNNGRNLLQRFNVRSSRSLLPTNNPAFNLPTLNWPLVGELDLRARSRYRVPCGEIAVHLGVCNAAHLATFGWGTGQVVLLSSLYPLTNEGLQTSANARLMQNLVELTTRPNTTVLVDETHRAGIGAFLRSRATLALLITAVALAAYFLWQNQPFNNPVGQSHQISEPESFNSTSAFINHIATAQKELDPHRDDVREFFWRQVKRKYANRHGFDTEQEDQLFFEQLRKVEEEETIGNLIYIMTTMAKQQIDDLELMHWMSVTLDHLAEEK